MTEPLATAAEVEAANEELTRCFNQAWSDRDCDHLLTLLSEDVRYIVY